MNIFQKIYNYRELLKTNVKKEIRGRYKNSILGILWSFLNPLLQLAVYSVIFGALLAGGDKTYHIYICVALIPWTYFTTTITQSAFTIIGNGDIIKKVYFPREILPISVVTSEAVNFLISTVIIFAFVIFSGIGITKYILVYPLIFIAQYLLLLAISFIVSSVCVYVRDLQHFIGIFLQLLFYATPIVYSIDTLPPEAAWILNLNPMTYIIEGYRDIFYNQTMPDVQSILILIGIVLVAIVIGYLIFNKLQKGFAEEL